MGAPPGQLRPLAPGLGARLFELIPRTKDGYIAYKLLTELGPELVTAPHKTLHETIAAVYLGMPFEDTLRAVAQWAHKDGRAAGVDGQRMFCELLPGATARERVRAFTLILPGVDDPCVVATIMAAYEQAALAPPDGPCGDTPEWMLTADFWLRKQRPDDPRIAAWAGSLAPRVVNPCHTETLRRLGPEQAPTSP